MSQSPDRSILQTETFAQLYGGTFAPRQAKAPKPKLHRYSRGERRNAARAVCNRRDGKALTEKSFREVWEQAYRLPIEPTMQVLPGALQRLGRLIVRHLGVRDMPFLMHPTKGWRGKDGLPLGHKVPA